MEKVSVRDLRNHGGEILDQVARGERLTVTRDGVEVAELSPVSAVPKSLSVIIAHRRNLPAVDPRALRADVDAVLDQTL